MKWHDAQKEWPQNDEQEILAYFDCDYYKVLRLIQDWETKKLEPNCCYYPSMPRENILYWCYVKDIPLPKDEL